MYVLERMTNNNSSSKVQTYFQKGAFFFLTVIFLPDLTLYVHSIVNKWGVWLAGHPGGRIGQGHFFGRDDRWNDSAMLSEWCGPQACRAYLERIERESRQHHVRR